MQLLLKATKKIKSASYQDFSHLISYDSVSYLLCPVPLLQVETQCLRPFHAVLFHNFLLEFFFVSLLCI